MMTKYRTITLDKIKTDEDTSDEEFIVCPTAETSLDELTYSGRYQQN